MTADRASSQAGIPYQQYPTRGEEEVDFLRTVTALDAAAREMSRRIVADREAALSWRLSVVQAQSFVADVAPNGVPISGDHRPLWARG